MRNLETTEAIAALEGEMRRYHRRRMKIAVHAVVATVIAAAFLAAIASAQATDSVPSQADSNMACVERLEIPRYPALATQARIEATVTASVLISPEGLPKESGTEVNGNSHGRAAYLHRPFGRRLTRVSFALTVPGRSSSSSSTSGFKAPQQVNRGRAFRSSIRMRFGLCPKRSTFSPTNRLGAR